MPTPKKVSTKRTDKLGSTPLVAEIGDDKKEYTFTQVTLRTMVVDAAACIRNDSIKSINSVADMTAIERFNSIALAAKQAITQAEVFAWIETFEGCLWLLLKSLMPLNKDARQVVAELDWETANNLVNMMLAHTGWYGEGGDQATADPTNQEPTSTGETDSAT